MLDVDDFEWIEIDSNDYSDAIHSKRVTERAKVPGGWLVLVITEWYGARENDSDKYTATENVIYVPDPNYTWGIK